MTAPRCARCSPTRTAPPRSRSARPPCRGNIWCRATSLFLGRGPSSIIPCVPSDGEQVHGSRRSGQIAVGFVGAVSEPENVDYFPLYDDRLVIAAPNNEHYRAFRERGVYGRELLLEEPFVSREEGSGTDTSLQNYLRTLGLSHDMLHVVARIRRSEAIKQMVSRQRGRCRALGARRGAEVQNGTLLRLRDGQKRAQAHDLSHHAQIAAALPHGAKARRLFESPHRRSAPERRTKSKKARQKPCLSIIFTSSESRTGRAFHTACSSWRRSHSRSW